VARVNYQREKRLKDLDRQRKQEEKRNRKLQKDSGAQPSEDDPASTPEGQGNAPDSEEPA